MAKWRLEVLLHWWAKLISFVGWYKYCVIYENLLPFCFLLHIRLLLLSCFSCVWLCATPYTAAHQAPLSLGFSRQEHWSGLPFPSPMHQSEKWKWSCAVVYDSSRPHGLQPTRLLRPWDFPSKHCLLCHIRLLVTKIAVIYWQHQQFKSQYGSYKAA